MVVRRIKMIGRREYLYIGIKFLNTNDRSVGPRPHWGRMKRGSAFPQPKASCMFFLIQGDINNNV